MDCPGKWIEEEEIDGEDKEKDGEAVEEIFELY